MPRSQLSAFPIPPGEQLTLHYDWDDINFSEIIVETPDAQLHELVVNPDPTAIQYTAPSVTDFRIDDPSELPLATPAVADAHRAEIESRGSWVPVVAGVIPAVTFAFLLRYCRGQRRKGN
ncbi:hypothetical protein ACFL6C_13625 [Myxococcota bacterium]